MARSMQQKEAMRRAKFAASWSGSQVLGILSRPGSLLLSRLESQHMKNAVGSWWLAVAGWCSTGARADESFKVGNL